MTRILQVVSSLDCGGVEKLLLEYCTRICKNSDVHIDIVAFDQKKGLLEDKFTQLGCRIFKVTRISESLSKMYREICSILKKGNYDVVHCHQGYKSLPVMAAAYQNGVRSRIAHAHFAFVPESSLSKALRKTMTFFIKLLATDLFACGIDAGRWTWGIRCSDAGLVRVMKNALDVNRYAFDPDCREQIRNELGIGDKTVVGCVARLNYQKNHDFLIDVFNEITKTADNAVLVLAGDGELYEPISENVNRYGISDKVIFLGARDDVCRLLNAFDVFVLTSLFEGLPIVLLEAQCNGLHCVASDSITKEVNVSDGVDYLSLSESAGVWSSKILSSAVRTDKDTAVKNIRNNGYDIDTEAQKLMGFYKKAGENIGRRK